MGKVHSNSSRGFTLVELQVALLLVAMIAVLLTGALFIASKTWIKVTERQDHAEQQYLLSNFLRRHIANARFQNLMTVDGQQAISFFGTPQLVHFIAPFPTFHNDGELYWWTLQLQWDESQDTEKLVLLYRPFVEDQVVEFNGDGGLFMTSDSEDEDLSIEPQILPLSDDIVSLELEYYLLERERDGSMTEAEWVEEWLGERSPPLLIRVQLERNVLDGEPEVLPEIVVAPRFANQLMFAEAS